MHTCENATLAYQELWYSQRGPLQLLRILSRTEIVAPPSPNVVLIESQDLPIETREWDFRELTSLVDL